MNPLFIVPDQGPEFDRLRNLYDIAGRHGACGMEAALRIYGRHTPDTAQKARELRERGYVFIPGNNPRLGDTKRWGSMLDCVRVALVNHRVHGESVKTLWAVRPKLYVQVMPLSEGGE